MKRTVLGLERFLAEPPGWAKTAKVGLLSHPAAVDGRYLSSVELLAGLFGSRLKTLFGPQHGFFGEKQDNMVASDHGRHPGLGVRIFSLYGERRELEPEWLEGLDVLLVDLQDVGCRVYTFIQTLHLTMKACARAGVKVVVLDRPNPLGRAAEGNLLEDNCRSFVGLFPLPMRHGLTVGEAAKLIQAEHSGGELEVVAMKNYDPEAGFAATGLDFVMPSPNMPRLETALVYPGQVLWEGTNLSEGRGTTRPFEIFGAPFVDPYALRARLAGRDLPGVVFRPLFFEPTFHKHAGKLCGGLHLHLTDPRAFRPYRTSLDLLQAVAALWPEEFRFKDPPYEYEFVRRPIDLILGKKGLADRVATGTGLDILEQDWSGGLGAFLDSSRRFHLY